MTSTRTTTPLEQGERVETVPEGWVRCPRCNPEGDERRRHVGWPSFKVHFAAGLRRSSSAWCECCLPSLPQFDVSPFDFEIQWHLDRGQHPGWVEEHRAIEHALLMSNL